MPTNTPVLALTATAISTTKGLISRSLRLDDPFVISVSPDRPNVHYSVVRISVCDVTVPFKWLIGDLQRNLAKTIVFSRSIAACAKLYKHFLTCLTLSGREILLKISRVDGGWVWPVQSQEWKVKFFVPQATNSIWRRETRTMATPMRSLSVGVTKSVREWFLDRRGRGCDDRVHRRRSIAKSVQKRSRLK